MYLMNLFQISSELSLDEDSLKYLKNVLDHPSVVTHWIVKLNLDVFKQKSFKVNLIESCDTFEVHDFKINDDNETEKIIFSWKNTVGCSVSISIRDKRASGMIYNKTSIYHLEPLTKEYLVLKQIDQSKFSEKC